MPKIPNGFFVKCDVLNCQEHTDIFPGGERHLEQEGWVFVYPTQPNNDCDCRVFCPAHRRLAQYVDRSITFYLQKDIPFLAAKP